MKYAFRKKRYTILASAVDALGGLLTLRRSSRPFPAAPKKVLVVRLDHIGDILPATALPQILKENFAGCELHFLTNRAGEALLANNPFVDRVWVFEPAWYARGRAVRAGMQYGALVRALRRESFDLAFSLRGDARENLLLRRARVRCAVGYGATGGGFLLDRVAAYAPEAASHTHTQNLLTFAGIRTGSLDPKVYFSEEEEKNFRHDLEKWGIEGRGWIGVQVDAGTEAKQWPLHNLERLVRLFENEWPQAKLVFIGSDRSRGEWLEGRLSESSARNRVNLVGKTNLRQLCYLIRSLRCFVGADSGPAHLASALGLPTLFLASGTNVFEKWKPASENAHFLNNPVPCAPCHLVSCVVTGHPCMSGIAPERVMAWLKDRA